MAGFKPGRRTTYGVVENTGCGSTPSYIFARHHDGLRCRNHCADASVRFLTVAEGCDLTRRNLKSIPALVLWILKWKRRHWWRKHEPVRNADLWMELDELASRQKTTWI